MNTTKLQDRRYDFQVQQINEKVAITMAKIRDFTGAEFTMRQEKRWPNIKEIERIAKHERVRCPINFRPMFDELLQEQLKKYMKEHFTL